MILIEPLNYDSYGILIGIVHDIHNFISSPQWLQNVRNEHNTQKEEASDQCSLASENRHLTVHKTLWLLKPGLHTDITMLDNSDHKSLKYRGCLDLT